MLRKIASHLMSCDAGLHFVDAGLHFVDTFAGNMTCSITVTVSNLPYNQAWPIDRRHSSLSILKLQIGNHAGKVRSKTTFRNIYLALM